jgi:hypothetical protein
MIRQAFHDGSDTDDHPDRCAGIVTGDVRADMIKPG